jgi:hypothetical protein
VIAFIDELSRRVPGEGPGERSYLLVAVAILRDDASEIRDLLRDLLRRGQDRLHWRDEKASVRMQIVKTIASLEIYGYGAICTFDVGTRESGLGPSAWRTWCANSIKPTCGNWSWRADRNH